MSEVKNLWGAGGFKDNSSLNPGSVEILKKTSDRPVVFEKASTGQQDTLAAGDAGGTRGTAGLWVRITIEKIKCWAIIDTGASRSVMSESL